MNWDKLKEEQKQEKLDKLWNICEGLLIHHPDYSSFKTVEVTLIDDKTCIIKWNGKRLDKVSGWGLVTREFPTSDFSDVIRRYSNKLQRVI